MYPKKIVGGKFYKLFIDSWTSNYPYNGTKYKGLFFQTKRRSIGYGYGKYGKNRKWGFI